MKTSNLLKIFLLTFCCSGCLFEPPEEIDSLNDVGEVEGLKPIYGPVAGWQTYSIDEPQPIKNLGKIYYKKPYIFVSESARGVHIIDNRDSTAPERIKFLSIPGNTDVAIRGNYLYADNMTDLVVFDISDLNEVKFLNRVKNIYPDEVRGILNFPPGYTGYFSCIEEGLGEVVGWEKATLNNPQCFR